MYTRHVKSELHVMVSDTLSFSMKYKRILDVKCNTLGTVRNSK